MYKKRDRHKEKHFAEKSFDPSYSMTQTPEKHREETGVEMSHTHTSLNSGHNIQTQQPNPTPAGAMSDITSSSVCGRIAIVQNKTF